MESRLGSGKARKSNKRRASRQKLMPQGVGVVLYTGQSDRHGAKSRLLRVTRPCYSFAEH